MKHLAVIALGGNAILRGSESGTIQQQEINTYNTCAHLVDLIRKDYNLVITHGNGPQVGNILLRNEAGYTQYKIPKMPLDVCVADSQGGIGYMIERQMRNILQENDLSKEVITIVTQALVDKDDPAFKDPTKPVGAYYIEEEAELLTKINNWVFREDPGKRGWRRLVASPSPKDILNKNIIKEMAERGNIVIAVGGGGIPVFLNDNNYLQGIEAVIDKDLASSLLAKEIKADIFYMLTDVPKVYINYKQASQKALDVITLSEAKDLYSKGEFSAGSMGPKILAAIQFIEQGGKEVIITEASNLGDKQNGTKIIK